mmetsp:Transcript_1091/g.4074  ORF Transcript_1091/g.4074 Transcript_1091/m.4074 type:complete len:209 (-) Transcript_1091:66-692(-)
MVTVHGEVVWSIWILAPVCDWRPLIVSPPRLMTRPTISFGHSTRCCAWPGPTEPERTGPPLRRSSTSLVAMSTHPAGPEMEIFRGTPSGKFWSTVMCAPDCAWSPLMVSPPFPMTLPTSPGGQSTRLVVMSIPAVLCGFGVAGGGASVGEPDARRSSPGATAALTAAAADEGSPGGTGGAGSSVVGAASAGMSFIVRQSRGEYRAEGL